MMAKSSLSFRTVYKPVILFPSAERLLLLHFGVWNWKMTQNATFKLHNSIYNLRILCYELF